MNLIDTGQEGTGPFRCRTINMSKLEKVSDKELIRMIRHDRTRDKGFRMIYERYHRELYWFLRKIVWTHENADDVLQETWMKIFNHLDDFREESALKSWMYRIAHNEALQFLRKNRRQVTSGSQDLSSVDLQADPWFKGNKIHEILLKAVAQLPERQRQIFELKYFSDLKYSEIARILDLTEGALKASYHHAVQKITHFVKENSEGI